MKIPPEIFKLAQRMQNGEMNKVEIPNYKVQINKKNKIAVSVTCHYKYLHFLLDQLCAINNQSVKADEKFLFLDDCEIDGLKCMFPDWKIIHGVWHSPNPARNVAIRETNCDWIVFADADDIMHTDYIKSIRENLNKVENNVAILYADLEYTNGQKYCVPKSFDYWELRITNSISACSAWRIEALKEINGIDERIERYDDWSTALSITSRGWIAVKNNDCNIIVRKHNGEHRNTFKDDSSTMSHKMFSRSYAVVTLFAGRFNTLHSWAYWLQNAELPEKFAVYAYDNSHNPDFSVELVKIIQKLQLSNKFLHIDYIKDYSEVKKIDEWDKHRHVNELYNKIVPKIKEDMLLFWEDDLIPPLDGLKRLIEETNVTHSIGGASAAYASRSCRESITAAYGAKKGGEDYWHDIVTWNDCKKTSIIEVDYIAGGFALYNNGLVQKALPFRFFIYKDLYAGGWDSNLSRSIRQYSVRKDGRPHKLIVVSDVFCEHLIGNNYGTN